MTEEECCPQCGMEQPEDAPEGLCPRCLMKVMQADDSDMAAESAPGIEGPGTKIGRYELLELIGEGGMGLVYLAQQQEPVKRQVALKIVKLGMDTRQVVARFEAERQTLALLAHPNIAHVFDAGTTETGRPYFVMEYVEGRSITKYCDEHKLSVEQRLELFQQVCEGVHHAHQKGIIHRDLKPSNILVSIHGDRAVPKIIDFGIAKAVTQPLTEKTLFTEHGQLLGTPEYMSPEQAEMAYQDVDTRSDIYSLGVLLYELLAGATPFDAKRLRKGGIDHLQQVICSEEPRTPSARLTSLGDKAEAVAERRRTQIVTLTRRLHRELEWIPMKAMRKDRSRRYRSASELSDDIQNYLTGTPLIAGPESNVYRARKFVHKHAGSVTSAALVAVVIVIGLITSTAFSFSAEKARGEEAVARTEAEQARDKEAAARTQVEQALVRAENAEKSAQEQHKIAEEQSKKYRNLSYVHGVALADAKYREHNLRSAQQLLESCPEDLRNWEWHRLNYIMDEAMITFKPPSRASRVAFSPDGKSLASGNSDGTVTVWEAATGAEVRTLTGHKEGVESLALSPDGKRIASGSSGGTIKIWNVNNGGELVTIQINTGGIRSIVFTPDGTQIVSSGYGKKPIQVWNANNGENILTIQVDDNWINQIALSPDGSRIIAGSIGALIQWDAATGEKIGVLELEKKNLSAYCISYSPDGTQVAVGCLRGQIMVLDIVNGSEVMSIEGSGRGRDMIAAIAFSPDGRRVIAGGSDKIITILDAETGDRISNLIGHRDVIRSLAWSKDGNRIASTSFSGRIKVWDPEKDRERTVLAGHDRWVQDMVFTPDGKQLISASEDRTIKVWDVSTGREISTLRGHGDRVDCVSVSHDGDHLASGGHDRTVKLWDLASTQQIRSIAGHQGTVYSVAFSPDDKHIASGGGDRKIRIWDTATGDELRTLSGHEGFVYSVAFSPDGKRIVSGGETAIKVWDASTGQELMTCHGHRKWAYILSVMFTPDGKRIVSGSYDATIRIWDAATGEELKVLHGHKGNIQALAMSKDGTRIVSASHDCTAKVWDTVTGAELMTLPAGDFEVLGIAFSPDGKNIAAACDRTGDITLWQSAPPSAADGSEHSRESRQKVLDSRRIRENAQRMVDELHGEYGLYSKVLERLKGDVTLDEPLREATLQIAESRQWEDARKLLMESMKVIVSPGGEIDVYRSALMKIETANELTPNDPLISHLLGVAQYRAGFYEDALETLTHSGKTGTSDQFKVAKVAFTAMALYQLNRNEEAAATLDHLRDLCEDKQVTRPKLAQALLAEAERLFASNKK
ncbi:protein kinase [Planctomycetota bacterium]